MVQTRTDQAARDKVWEMIRGIDVAMLVTLNARGRMRGRPMRAAALKDFAGTLWFFTRQPTPETQEIRDDDRVLLAYADPKTESYVAVSGHARVVRDLARQTALWSEPLRAWFPQGPDAPEAALLSVEVEGAEYWDVPAMGENDKVRFDRPA